MQVTAASNTDGDRASNSNWNRAEAVSDEHTSSRSCQQKNNEASVNTTTPEAATTE